MSLASLVKRAKHLHKNTINEVLKFIFLAAWAIAFVSIDFNADFPPHNDDDLTYVTIAKSFSEGRGYQNIAVPTRENNFIAPSAFPLVLTIYWFFLSPNIFILKAFITLFLIVGVWLSYRWLTLFIPGIEAFLIALAFASLPEFIMLANSMMTETLFVPVLYLALLFSAKFAGDHYKGNYGWPAMAFWLILSRTRAIGIIFLAVFVVLLIVKRQWKKAFVSGVLFFLWIAFEKSLIIQAAIPRSYGQGVKALGDSLVLSHSSFMSTTMGFYFTNIRAFVSSFYAKSLFPYFYSLSEMNHIKLVLTTGIFLIGTAGAVWLWKARPFIRSYMAALLIMSIIIFKWDEFGALHRYLFPVYPFLVLAFVYCFHVLADKSVFLKKINITLVICLLIVANNGLYSARFFSPWAENYWDRENLLRIHEFINHRSPRPQIIVSSMNMYTYLKTGIHSVQFSDTLNITNYCRTLGATDVLVVTQKQNGKPFGKGENSPFTTGTLLTKMGTWSLYHVDR
jgi:hypothetical protein